MKRFLSLFAGLIILVILILSSPGCKNYNEVDLYPPCDTSNITYAKDISPIFLGNCMPCHNIYSKAFGINLDVLDSARIPARNGLLILAVTHANGVVPMPLGGPKLSDCNINKIRRWINLGEPAR